jgi:hypothetical protein
MIKRFFCLMGVGLTIICISCNTNTSNSNMLSTDLIDNPLSASSAKTDSLSLPKISFVTNEHDFGFIKEGEKVQCSFLYTNKGNSPLIISTIKTSCGCTATEYTKSPVLPNDTGVVKVTFNSEGFPGSFQKTVEVVSNTIPNQTKLLIIGDVE